MEHLKGCKSCKEVYEYMQGEIGLQESLGSYEIRINEKEEKEFWSKYYGRFLIQGGQLFFTIYIIAMILKTIV